MVEPVLGEGGYLPCPPGYLKGLRDICDRYLTAQHMIAHTAHGSTGHHLYITCTSLTHRAPEVGNEC